MLVDNYDVVVLQLSPLFFVLRGIYHRWCAVDSGPMDDEPIITSSPTNLIQQYLQAWTLRLLAQPICLPEEALTV